jgi:hypothetical protein
MHAVEKQFDEFEGRGVGSHVTQEADGIAADGDAGAIRIILFWMHFTNHHDVAYFLLFMDRDVMVVYKKEGVSARNPFCVMGKNRIPCLGIAVRCVPGGFVAGVTMELAMFEEFASGGVGTKRASGPLTCVNA